MPPAGVMCGINYPPMIEESMVSLSQILYLQKLLWAVTLYLLPPAWAIPIYDRREYSFTNTFFAKTFEVSHTIISPATSWCDALLSVGYSHI